MQMKKHISKSFDYVIEGYRQLLDKLAMTEDARERKILLRRLVNLIGVMQFLLGIQMISDKIDLLK